MLTLIASLLIGPPPTQSLPPAVGEKAPAFEVADLEGRPVRLAPLLRRGPVVLVVLRGWPGYQCPFCTRQVGELMGRADAFARRGSTVVLVYPGPAADLERRAAEFISGKDVPKGFRFALDPGYRMTLGYGLRWDAPHETAYPSTFVIAEDGRIAYAKVSREHGGRPPVAALGGLKP